MLEISWKRKILSLPAVPRHDVHASALVFRIYAGKPQPITNRTTAVSQHSLLVPLREVLFCGRNINLFHRLLFPFDSLAKGQLTCPDRVGRRRQIFPAALPALSFALYRHSLLLQCTPPNLKFSYRLYTKGQPLPAAHSVIFTAASVHG